MIEGNILAAIKGGARKGASLFRFCATTFGGTGEADLLLLGVVNSEAELLRCEQTVEKRNNVAGKLEW